MEYEEETFTSPNGMIRSDMDNSSKEANMDGEREEQITPQSMKHSDVGGAPNMDDEGETSTSQQQKITFVRAMAMTRHYSSDSDEAESDVKLLLLKETITCAQGMKRVSEDETDSIFVPETGMERNVTEASFREKRDAEEDPSKSKLYLLYKLAMAIIGMITYIVTFIIDGILLEHYFSQSDFFWFGITFIFVLTPAIIIQILSCKWFHDDNGKLKSWSVVLHVFLLGPLERYWYTLAYCWKKLLHPHCKAVQLREQYFANWRDVSMLRFIYAFLETGTQVTFQLYILLTQNLLDSSVNLVKADAIAIIKIAFTVVSLSASMVAYNDNLRIYEAKGLSIVAFACQILYRLLLIAARILTIVLFATVFKWITIVIIFVHWIVMIFWVRRDNPKFFSKTNGKYNKCFEKIFQVLMGFIYIFCYITTIDGSTAISQMVYYLIFFFETVAIMIAWMLKNDRYLDRFEVASLVVVFSTLALGIACMLLYYKVFHPASKRNTSNENPVHSAVKKMLKR